MNDAPGEDDAGDAEADEQSLAQAVAVTGTHEHETHSDKARNARAEQQSIRRGAARILPSGLLGGVCRIQGPQGVPHLAREQHRRDVPAGQGNEPPRAHDRDDESAERARPGADGKTHPHRRTFPARLSFVRGRHARTHWH